MYDNYNYPASSDTPDAPWNEPIPQQRDIDIKATFTLSKVVSAKTSNDAQITNCGQAFDESGHLTISELLRELEFYIKDDLMTCSKNTCKRSYLNRLLAACKGWEVIEESYEEQ